MQETIIMLDVRTEPEYRSGHKEGAHHFDLQRLLNGELPPFPPDTHIRVYCRSGGRSMVAASILSSNGYSNVHDDGGIE